MNHNSTPAHGTLTLGGQDASGELPLHPLLIQNSLIQTQWTPFALPPAMFQKLMRERLESLHLLNVRPAFPENCWSQRKSANWPFEVYHEIASQEGVTGIHMVCQSPWVEIWQHRSIGNKDEFYPIYWVDPFHGMVISRHKSPDRVPEIGLAVAKQIEASLDKFLSSTIKLSHASKKTSQNTERLFEVSRFSQEVPTVRQYLKTACGGKTFLHRAYKVHGEAITKALASAGVFPDAGKTSGVSKTKTSAPKRKPKMPSVPKK